MAETKKEDDGITAPNTPELTEPSYNSNIFLLNLRVYVAGILMPVTAVTIRTRSDAPAVAQVTMPAQPALYPIGRMDRVPVQIFVLESMVESPKFILIFEGFVSAKSYRNLATQREISFNAVSYMDVLNDVHIRFMATVDDIFKSQVAHNGELAQPITSLQGFPYILFHKKLGLESRPDNFITYPSKFLTNLFGFIEKSGDEAWATQYNNSEVSKYYKKLAESLHLMRRYRKLPYFDIVYDTPEDQDFFAKYYERGSSRIFPILYGMQTKMALDWMSTNIQNNVDVYSIMGLLDFVAQKMEYEHAFISNPAYHKLGDEGEDTEKDSHLIAACFKPTFMDSIPPQCNVIFRSQIDSIDTTEDYLRVPTRIQYRDPASLMHRTLAAQLNSPISDILLIDYYPRKEEQYRNDTPSEAAAKLAAAAGEKEEAKRLLSSYLLDAEKYTGPWVAEVSTPGWFSFIDLSKGRLPEGTPGALPMSELIAQFRRAFCERQLLTAKYFKRTVNVTGMFNPYITPGFPGVVFDHAYSGFAFAGHVVAVEHSFMPGSVSTSYTMNAVRDLEEAAMFNIPHPVPAMDEVVHNTKRMEKVYRAILGTPDVDNIAGAKPISYMDLYWLYLGKKIDASVSQVTTVGTAAPGSPTLGANWTMTSSEHPQNNPKKAYEFQRRNIVTFDDYLDFMGLTAVTGEGPEGPNTPIKLTGAFVEERRPIDRYDPFADEWKAQGEALAKAVMEGWGTATTVFYPNP